MSFLSTRVVFNVSSSYSGLISMSDSEKNVHDDEEKNEIMDDDLTPIQPKPRGKTRLPKSISTPVLSSFSPSRNKNISKSKEINDALKLYRSIPSYRLLIRDIIKADIPIIEKRRFLLCPHRHHCIQNAFMKGFWRTFAAAFIFKTSLAFFTSLFSGKLFKNGTISWQRIRQIYLSQDSLLFANIFALMSFTYKVILCCLRRYRLRDPVWHKTIAGFICSTFILLDAPKRRNTIALYCIVRAISDAVRLCVAHKKITAIKHFDVMTFSASQVIIMFAAIKDPTHLDRKYYKWILGMGNLPEHAVQMVLRSPSGANYRLPHEQFMECYPIWHNTHSCLYFSAKDWFLALGRAAKMYFPVHFVPTILLSPKSILLEPVKFIKKKTWNTMVSAMFLATYVFNMRYTLCFVRNIIRDDPWWLACFGGLMTGLSLFIENERRRPELMLYCVPKAMEWIMKRVKQNTFPNVYKLLRTNVFPTVIFQIAVAMWCTIWNFPKGIKNSNSINMTVMGIIFGSKH